MRLKDLFLCTTQVGSTVTCNPPVTNTDTDFLILIKEESKRLVHDLLGKSDWFCAYETYRSSTGEDKPFRAYRKGKINYIITWDEDYHRRFLEASDLAKRFNLLNKADRVDLFNLALYGTYKQTQTSTDDIPF